MAAGKFAAGTGFKIGLEGGGFFAGGEGDGEVDDPGPELGGMGYAAFVVLAEAKRQVVGEADVGLAGNLEAAEPVDVVEMIHGLPAVAAAAAARSAFAPPGAGTPADSLRAARGRPREGG